jgi:hypothetical protein
MVKVTLNITKLELEMLSYCIESAIDVKHMSDKDMESAKKILKQLKNHI